MNKINILGTEWTIEYREEHEDEKLENCNGYCDPSIKKIIVQHRFEKNINNMADLEGYYKEKVVRHEILHAFFYESGLGQESGYYFDERLIDWIAIQFPKINKIFEEIGIN